MAKLKLRGKDLLKIGFEQGPAVGLAITQMQRHYKFNSKQHALTILKAMLADPEAYAEDEVLGPVVEKLRDAEPVENPEIALRETGVDYRVYGSEHIAPNAREQMEVAMRLPVAEAGALMPDAHHGYGLPIGGVLATRNAIIPYGVGVDIGCRMCLTVYDLPVSKLSEDRSQFVNLLGEHTRFGRDAFDRPMSDPIFDRPEFREIPTVKGLRQKAIKQIGSSGSGNHFVEFGEVTLDDPEKGLPSGTYIGLLSHSGSRGLGANIANHYTKLAMEQTPLPKEAQHLAWLVLDSELGQEYWLAMNLAGDYASACHHHIHRRVAGALGLEPIVTIENHHNFAWKETATDGSELIVHRKGATPAGKGVLGIIPGSMTAPAFLVRGKGVVDSIQSASHGAGRQVSRRKAIQSFTKKQLKQALKKHDVDLIGGGMDEVPFAYKDIHAVMEHQRDLVDVLGTFQPKVVRMDG